MFIVACTAEVNLHKCTQCKAGESFIELPTKVPASTKFSMVFQIQYRNCESLNFVLLDGLHTIVLCKKSNSKYIPTPQYLKHFFIEQELLTVAYVQVTISADFGKVDPCNVFVVDTSTFFSNKVVG